MFARDLKRSIQDPDGDFVRIATVSGMGGSKLTDAEMERIRESAEFNAEYEDEYDEYYEEERRRRQKAAKNGKNEADQKMSKVMKTLTIVAACIFVALIIGLMVYVIGSVNGKFGQSVTEGVEKNIVPNMIGMDLDDAKDACAAAGITLQVVVEEKSIEYDKNIIFKQLTQSGTKLPEGARVQVHVSTGLKDIEMPDVVGEDEDDAIKELKRVGFKEKKIEIEYEEHMTVKKGDVIRTNPKAGKIGNSKSDIIVYVSKGVGKTEVPFVEGKKQSEAEKLLTAAGLEFEIQLEQNDAEEGTVLGQSIESGKTVDKGTKITLVVSAGDEVLIPNDLVGKSYKDVKKTLEDLGLTVDLIKVTDEVEEAGAVTYVQNAGKKVTQGISITVKYSETVKSSGTGTGSGTGGGTGN
jgi:serine/threonine-protein kinase